MTFSITEYYWWIYHLPNGGFDFEGYWNHIPDGVAFGGTEWYFDDPEGTGYTVPAYMWYKNTNCYFSLGFVGNTDPASSGTCKVEGHYTIGDLQQGIVKDVEDIVWYFTSRPEIAYKFYFHAGQWGPLEMMTEGRFFSNDNSRNLWLYEKPDEYCAVCGLNAVNWDVLGFDEASEVNYAGTGDVDYVETVGDWDSYYESFSYTTTE